MKRVICLLGSSLVLIWASAGPATAQPLSGLTGPLDKVVDTVTTPVDKVVDVIDEVKEPVTKTIPSLPDPVKKPVEDVTKEVEKVIDQVVQDVTDVARDPAGATGTVGTKPGQAPAPGNSSPSKQDVAPSALATKTKVARTTTESGKSAKKANRARPARDTEQVAAAGNSIEPAEVKGTQIIAPATDVDESEGSGLSLTGVQILAWLILASWLMGTGAAFVWRGQIRVRAVRS